MKPRFLKLRSAVVAVVAMMFAQCMSSCSNDDDEFVAWDYFPISVYFMFVDEEGNDLIAEDGSLYRTNISVKYLRETYTAKWPLLEDEFGNKIQYENQGEQQHDRSKSRAYLPILYGLIYRTAKDGELSILEFGELDGDIGVALLNLELPDGKKHEILIKRRIYTKGHNMDVKQTVEFDGKVIDSLSDGSTGLKFKIVVE